MIAGYVELNTIEGADLLFGAVVRDSIALASKQVSASILPTVQDWASAPGAVKYPIRWKSQKQRRAFFATDGFGHGIPYVRTGNTARAWRFTQLDIDGALIVSLENSNPAALFVYGSFTAPQDQQPFHVDTGWISAPTLEQKTFDLYERGMRDIFTRDANALFEVKR